MDAEQHAQWQRGECVGSAVGVAKLDFIMLIGMDHHDSANLAPHQTVLRTVLEQGDSVEFFQMGPQVNLRLVLGYSTVTDFARFLG